MDRKNSPHRKPADMSVEQWQYALRKQMATLQQYDVENIGEHSVFSDFNVFNPLSNNTYRVAIRSMEPGLNYCSCPDFITNHLGTCKHIEFLLTEIQTNNKTKRILHQGYTSEYSSMTLCYGVKRKVILRIGQHRSEEINKQLISTPNSDVIPMPCNTSLNYESFIIDTIISKLNMAPQTPLMDY